ncbi:hypothetical protein AAF712_013140 [Marasmius tenuissimus]|uniref:Uncharacterized protein n=1 Tax=Marasmius tenuissimus TaxID=585030 RepID=A0ABR2ZFT2_9AGAR
MSTTMFSFPSGIFIEGNQQFNQANGNIIINNNFGDEGSLCIRGQGRNRLMPIQDRFREIRQGDMILRNQVYLGVMEMTIKQQLKSTNPFRPRVEVRTVKIHRRAYSVELLEFSNRKFPLFVFQPENKEDKKMVTKVSSIKQFEGRGKTVWFRFGNKFMRGCLHARHFYRLRCLDWVDLISQPSYHMMVRTFVGGGGVWGTD